MTDRSNDGPGQGMLLVEAVEALKSSWSTGESSIESIGSQLEPSTRLPTLLQLVRMDCELALNAGRDIDAQRYLNLFPELVPQRSLIERFVHECRQKLTKIEDANTPESSLVGMFSKASIAPTIDHVSDALQQEPSTSHKVKAATTNTPKMLGSYRLLREIGEGSFGKVYLALDVRLDREVAIKIQDPKRGDRGLSEAFLHEARAIGRLEHPNIVRLHHVDETEDGLGYLVYEFVSGTTLADRVKQGNSSLADVIGWIAAVARALDYAHRRGVVHRDISPRNIMITHEGTAKLLDFGLSRLDDSFPVPDENQLLGTPNFMSPEQASGKPHWATSYADIFSLGCVLYYALAGKVPFQGSSIFDICERVQSAAPPALRSIRRDITSQLEAVVNKAMAKEPQARYATGADFALALEGAVARAETVATKPAANNSLLVRILALVMVCVGVGFFWIAWKQYNDSVTRYENSLPSAEIDSVEILVERGTSDKKNLLSDHLKQLLPLQSNDKFEFHWKTSAVNVNAAKATLLVFNQANMKFTAFHPATESYPLDGVLLDGTTLVLLCLAKDNIQEDELKKLVRPFTSQSVFKPTQLDYLSYRAPTLRDVKGANQRGVPSSSNVQDVDFGEEFKKSLLELGVQSFFGVVLRRDPS